MPYSWIENVQSNLERLQDLKEEMQRIPGKVFETILEAVDQLVLLKASRQAVPNHCRPGEGCRDGCRKTIRIESNIGRTGSL